MQMSVPFRGERGRVQAQRRPQGYASEYAGKDGTNRSTWFRNDEVGGSNPPSAAMTDSVVI